MNCKSISVGLLFGCLGVPAVAAAVQAALRSEKVDHHPRRHAGIDASGDISFNTEQVEKSSHSLKQVEKQVENFLVDIEYDIESTVKSGVKSIGSGVNTIESSFLGEESDAEIEAKKQKKALKNRKKVETALGKTISQKVAIVNHSGKAWHITVGHCPSANDLTTWSTPVDPGLEGIMWMKCAQNSKCRGIEYEHTHDGKLKYRFSNSPMAAEGENKPPAVPASKPSAVLTAALAEASNVEIYDNSDTSSTDESSRYDVPAGYDNNEGSEMHQPDTMYQPDTTIISSFIEFEKVSTNTTNHKVLKIVHCAVPLGPARILEPSVTGCAMSQTASMENFSEEPSSYNDAVRVCLSHKEKCHGVETDPQCEHKAAWLTNEPFAMCKYRFYYVAIHKRNVGDPVQEPGVGRVRTIKKPVPKETADEDEDAKMPESDKEAAELAAKPEAPKGNPAEASSGAPTAEAPAASAGFAASAAPASLSYSDSYSTPPVVHKHGVCVLAYWPKYKCTGGEVDSSERLESTQKPHGDLLEECTSCFYGYEMTVDGTCEKKKIVEGIADDFSDWIKDNNTIRLMIVLACFVFVYIFYYIYQMFTSKTDDHYEEHEEYEEDASVVDVSGARE